MKSNKSLTWPNEKITANEIKFDLDVRKWFLISSTFGCLTLSGQSSSTSPSFLITLLGLSPLSVLQFSWRQKLSEPNTNYQIQIHTPKYEIYLTKYTFPNYISTFTKYTLPRNEHILQNVLQIHTPIYQIHTP